MTLLHAVVPAGLDDPARPSGGNRYDRRVLAGLAATGWDVREHHVAGDWPRPDAAAEAALNRVLAGAAGDGTVIVDGLIASSVPDLIAAAAGRGPVVVLAHMALGDRLVGHEIDDAAERERTALTAATAVVATSEWLRGRLLELYGLPAERVHVAVPGVDPAEPAPGTPGGGRLLSVAPVAPHKGHDVLLAALTTLAELPWRWVCVGPLERDPGFVRRLRARAAADGLGDRIYFAGARPPDGVAAAYAASDLLVHPSAGESFGLVVVEALARGLPVLATAVGGLPEALGRAAGGRRPGLLVLPGDATALAAALRRWLTEPGLRAELRGSAGERRTALPGWGETTAALARALRRAADELDGGRPRMPL